MKAGSKEYYAEYYQKNKERHNENIKEWRQKEGYSTTPFVKKWQEKNAEQVREYHRLNKQEQNKKIRQYINEYKSTCSCKKCGDNRPYVLDFHHVDPSEKEFDLGNASKYSMTKLKAEIEKCITLCRNCHSEFHYLEKEQNITVDQYLLKNDND